MTELAEVLRLLLSAGADPHATVNWTSRGRRRPRTFHSLTAECIIMHFFETYEATPQEFVLSEVVPFRAGNETDRATWTGPAQSHSQEADLESVAITQD